MKTLLFPLLTTALAFSQAADPYANSIQKPWSLGDASQSTSQLAAAAGNPITLKQTNPANPAALLDPPKASQTNTAKLAEDIAQFRRDIAKLESARIAGRWKMATDQFESGQVTSYTLELWRKEALQLAEGDADLQSTINAYPRPLPAPAPTPPPVAKTWTTSIPMPENYDDMQVLIRLQDSGASPAELAQLSATQEQNQLLKNQLRSQEQLAREVKRLRLFGQPTQFYPAY